MLPTEIFEQQIKLPALINWLVDAQELLQDYADDGDIDGYGASYMIGKLIRAVDYRDPEQFFEIIFSNVEGYKNALAYIAHTYITAWRQDSYGHAAEFMRIQGGLMTLLAETEVSAGKFS